MLKLLVTGIKGVRQGDSRNAECKQTRNVRSPWTRRLASTCSIPTMTTLRINEFFFFMFLGHRRCCRLFRRFATIEFSNDLGVNPIELLLREDTQKRPGKVKRVEDGPWFISTCTKPWIRTLRKSGYNSTNLGPQIDAQTCQGIRVLAYLLKIKLLRQRRLSLRQHHDQWRTWHTMQTRKWEEQESSFHLNLPVDLIHPHDLFW